MDAIKAVARAIFKPNTAWTFVFFPALFYYVGTRLYTLGLFRSSSYGEILNHELTWMNATAASFAHPSGAEPVCFDHKAAKEKLFYVQSGGNAGCDSSLRYPIHLVQEFVERSVVSTAWMEDDDLGRGYLLLSVSAGRGKVYRWEAGGGPIAIGRTLHLRDSGCRSGLYRNCSAAADDGTDRGSGGIAVESFRSDESRALIVAEYGEGRVVRMEKNGARTPLVTTTRPEGDDRLVRPFRLLATPYGDLMVLDDATTTTTARGERFALWRLPGASDVPGLPSLMVSREAHAWNRNNDTAFPEVFFESGGMGGMVLSPSGQGIYVTTIDPDSSSVVVLSFPLLEDLDDLDDTNENDAEGDNERADSTENNQGNTGREAASTQRTLRSRSKLVFDYSAQAKAPGAIEIDNNGNLYLAVDDGILVVSKSQALVAKIAFSTGDEKIVDLTLGSDRFLYIAMES
eukprot:CAMPEP_0197185544 /NCGR_PEP_ID=MMETSP1423-20130617/12172_1 /TAXON_ID=476441 /ORGANISM="Pseudo-nitzschia heimii, Strain UNC1101" /LENGTH=457 /DNA_ID=CAMNT_0042636635 /DNA_START=69 /DNA_END=1438 /DNA_ORIENTATION=+